MTGVIYMYTVAEKHYVGKTYMEQRKRIDKHKYEALTKKADSPFARAIRKHGWETVRASYEVLESVDAETKDELNRKLVEREAFWIAEKNSLVPNGYNVLKSGQLTIPHTKSKEEIYKKVSASLKGKHMNHPSTSRPVYCVDLEKWYPSVSEAERQLHITRGSVGKAASGKVITAGGHVWNFTGENTKPRENKKQHKAVQCIETGEVFPTAYDAAKAICGDKKLQSVYGVLKTGIKHGYKVYGLSYEYITM